MTIKNFIHADDFGMNDSISKSILDCIQNGSVNSVSVMVGGSNKYFNDLLKSGVKIKLHLNLTSNPKIYNSKNQELIRNLDFFKLLFLKKKYQQIVLDELKSQMKNYCEIFDIDTIAVDGHHHIQCIPWIYQSLPTFEEFNLSEVRISNEKIFIDKYSDFLNPRFYRNMLAVLILKQICSGINTKYQNTPNFYGLLYSGIHDISTIEKFIISQSSQVNEISFHPGMIKNQDIDTMHPKDFNYYNNNYRKVDYDLVFSEELKKFY